MHRQKVTSFQCCPFLQVKILEHNEKFLKPLEFKPKPGVREGDFGTIVDEVRLGDTTFEYLPLVIKT